MNEYYKEILDDKWNALKSIVDRSDEGIMLSWDDEDVLFLNGNSHLFGVEHDLTDLIEGKKQENEDDREIAITKLINDAMEDIRYCRKLYNEA